jgi:hypothetical protein
MLTLSLEDAMRNIFLVMSEAGEEGGRGGPSIGQSGDYTQQRPVHG